MIPPNHKERHKDRQKQKRAQDKILITAFCIQHNLSVMPFFPSRMSTEEENFPETRLLQKHTAVTSFQLQQSLVQLRGVMLLLTSGLHEPVWFRSMLEEHRFSGQNLLRV